MVAYEVPADKYCQTQNNLCPRQICSQRKHKILRHELVAGNGNGKLKRSLQLKVAAIDEDPAKNATTYPMQNAKGRGHVYLRIESINCFRTK